MSKDAAERYFKIVIFEFVIQSGNVLLTDKRDNLGFSKTLKLLNLINNQFIWLVL